MKKNLFYLILFFSGFAEAFELSLKDGPVVQYLTNEGESLRFRSLYAAENLKNRISSAQDEEKASQLSQLLQEKSVEAQHGLNLSRAISLALKDHAEKKPLTPKEREDLCGHQIQVYKSAIEMIQKLEASLYLKAESADYLIRMYQRSTKIYDGVCRGAAKSL